MDVVIRDVEWARFRGLDGGFLLLVLCGEPSVRGRKGINPAWFEPVTASAARRLVGRSVTTVFFFILCYVMKTACWCVQKLGSAASLPLLSVLCITSEEDALPVGDVVSLHVGDKSVAIKNRVLGVLLLSWNEDKIDCHFRSMN